MSNILLFTLHFILVLKLSIDTAVFTVSLYELSRIKLFEHSSAKIVKSLLGRLRIANEKGSKEAFWPVPIATELFTIFMRHNHYKARLLRSQYTQIRCVQAMQHSTRLVKPFLFRYAIGIDSILLV